MKVFVGGCSGVGKTTMLQVLSDNGFDVLHVTSRFMSWLGTENDYEALRSLPRQKREKLLNQFMSQLMSDSNSYVLDSHYSIMVNGKIMNSMNDWSKDVDIFVLITAPIEIIFKRIKKDLGRDRALFEETATREEKFNGLENFQKHLRKQSKELAESFSRPYLELSNVGDIQALGNQLISFLDSQKP